MMAMYTYQGPLTSFTLAGGRDVILTPGAAVELPDCDVVETLKALGRLIPVEPAPAPAAPKPKKGE
jgi:hypothetical protein